MKVFCISDLHLSLTCNKPMNIFGPVWDGSWEKICEDWTSKVKDDDIVLVAGDISWAMKLDDAICDIKEIDKLPGKKVFIRGNHDYWWETVSKMKRFFAENAIETIDFLHNSCYFYGGTALCGTRGWFFDKNDPTAGDDKVFKRELIRLEASLKAAMAQGAEDIDCFLHYPPVFAGAEVPQITDILARYPVKRVFYGHLHGESIRGAFRGVRGGIQYSLVSADAVGFAPVRIRD